MSAPNWTESDLPVGSQVSIRVANGKWFSRCRECDFYVYTATPEPRYRTVGPHERAIHALDVVGINVAMLS